MRLTTSKNAPKELKKTARALASLLPGGCFVPRGESRLERLTELARRAGEKTLLVLMASDKNSKPSPLKPGRLTPGPLFIIRARHLVSDESGSESWSWDERTLAVLKMDAGKRGAQIIFGEDLYVVVATKKDGEPSALISFLGLESHPLADFADAPLEVKVEAKKSKKKNNFKLAAGKEVLLSADYEWVD